MTAQFREKIKYKGKTYAMASLPLNNYLDTRHDIKFIARISACWRGYVGSWEIKDNKLFLTGLSATIEGNKEVNLKYLFPENKEVFADWYSGEIKIEVGELLQYEHHGFGSIFEKDIVVGIEQGTIVSENIIDNKSKIAKIKKLDNKNDKNKDSDSYWEKLLNSSLEDLFK